MSFTPLPTIFTDICDELDSPSTQIMELGCGDGRFLDVLSGLGLSCWGLDRIGPDCGTVAHVVGEAAAPPVLPRSLDLVVIPNLLRHMLPAEPGIGFLGGWLDMLKPGGSLFIFEDDPGKDSPGQVNYCDLQGFLSRLLPESRGPLISLEKFRTISATFQDRAAWEFGTVRNRQAIATGPVLDMLEQGNESGGIVGRLVESIRAHGLDSGYYWWARAVTGAEEVGN